MIFASPHIGSDNHYFGNNFAKIFPEPVYFLDLSIEFAKELRNLVEIVEESGGQKVCFYAPEDFENFLPVFFKVCVGWKLFIHFSDDEWRFSRFDRPMALFADGCSTSYNGNIKDFRSFGANVICIPVFSNPKDFFPLDCEFIYDVSFIGAASPVRYECVKYIIESGIDIKVFGNGWSAYTDIASNWGGVLNRSEMNDVFNASIINLNFFWTGAGGDRIQIKGRFAEIIHSGGFQIVNWCPELFSDYGLSEGESVVTFSSFKDLTDKIKYFLNNPSERSRISVQASRILRPRLLVNPNEVMANLQKFTGKGPSQVQVLSIAVVLKNGRYLRARPLEFAGFRFVFVANRSEADFLMSGVRVNCFCELTCCAMAALLYLDGKDVCLSAFSWREGGMRLELENEVKVFNYCLFFPAEVKMSRRVKQCETKKESGPTSSVAICGVAFNQNIGSSLGVIILMARFGFWREWKQTLFRNAVNRKNLLQTLVILIAHARLRAVFLLGNNGRSLTRFGRGRKY